MNVFSHTVTVMVTHLKLPFPPLSLSFFPSFYIFICTYSSFSFLILWHIILVFNLLAPLCLPVLLLALLPPRSLNHHLIPFYLYLHLCLSCNTLSLSLSLKRSRTLTHSFFLSPLMLVAHFFSLARVTLLTLTSSQVAAYDA